MFFDADIDADTDTMDLNKPKATDVTEENCEPITQSERKPVLSERGDETGMVSLPSNIYCCYKASSLLQYPGVHSMTLSDTV